MIGLDRAGAGLPGDLRERSVGGGLRPRMAGSAVATVLVGWALLAAPARAQESRALGLLEAASVRYASVDSFCADFHQRLEVPLLGDETEGSGRLCQARPDRFAMRFREPAGDAVVVDGEAVWLYWPSVDTAQVIKLPMADVPGGFDFHREFLSDPAAKYAATYEELEVVEGHSAHRIRLLPRTEVTYQSAVVWIDEGVPLLRRIRVEEENGSVRTVTLADVALGAEAPPGWFSFTPPPGAQVIAR